MAELLIQSMFWCTLTLALVTLMVSLLATAGLILPWYPHSHSRHVHHHLVFWRGLARQLARHPDPADLLGLACLEGAALAQESDATRHAPAWSYAHAHLGSRKAGRYIAGHRAR